MSNAISALMGATSEGFARVSDAGLRGMITLRGDLSDTRMQAAVTKLTGTDFPAARSITQKGEKAIAWMSPDELLVMLPYAQAQKAVDTLSKALKSQHCLVVNVSDARVLFRVEGKAAREVLAKLSPADVSPAALGPGEIRRTRVAQVAGAFWMSGPDAFELVTFRSTATYAFNLLKNAATQGAEVGYF